MCVGFCGAEEIPDVLNFEGKAVSIQQLKIKIQITLVFGAIYRM